MLKGIFLNNPTMNYGSSKNAEIILSKLIFYVETDNKMYKNRWTELIFSAHDLFFSAHHFLKVVPKIHTSTAVISLSERNQN